MKKLLVLFFFFLLIISLTFFFILKEPNKAGKATYPTDSNLAKSQPQNDIVASQNPGSLRESPVARDTSSSGGGGSGGGSGTGEAIINSEIIQNQTTSQPPICMLIRPGNLPDISCSVNYISSSQVSLKIKNELVNNLGIVISLDGCSPVLSANIEDMKEKDFIFSCSNSALFNEAISITYVIDSKQINVGGFVSGEVDYSINPSTP